MLPHPQKGEVWHGINRSGEIICDALIEQVMTNPKSDHTVLVTASVDATYLYDFITIRKKI